MSPASSRTESPWERWSRDDRALAHVTADELLRAFVLHLKRTVSNDRVIRVGKLRLEVPLALGPAGYPQRRLQITHRLLDDTYHVLCADRLLRLQPVDLTANARGQRQRATRDEREDRAPSPPPAKTAADLAFERDLGPVVDDDGGVQELPDFDEEGST
ncbi:MAG: hypothetical protein AB7O37_24055 [Vicinamibacteria bacterium]